MMQTTFIYIIAACFLDGLAGLLGGFLPQPFIQKNLTSFLAFAAGTLVGAAFLELLPEAIHHVQETGGGVNSVFLAALIGFVLFYAVEHFLGSHASGQSGHKHDTIGPLILVGDALHNAVDGAAIAASFLVDPQTGIATTLAVIVHELPQEIGDYAILISHGYSRKKAMFALFVVQLSALVGAAGAMAVQEFTAFASPYLMAISAGGFIYIASADLLPELQRRKQNRGPFFTLLAFGVGLTLIATLHLAH